MRDDSMMKATCSFFGGCRPGMGAIEAAVSYPLLGRHHAAARGKSATLLAGRRLRPDRPRLLQGQTRLCGFINNTCDAPSNCGGGAPTAGQGLQHQQAGL